MNKKILYLIMCTMFLIIVTSCGVENKEDIILDQSTKAGEFSNFESVDLDGNVVNQDVLSESNVTMINIWGTFCGPCISEMPYLGELSKEYDSSELQIIGIVTDVYDENGVVEAKNIVETTGANYLHLLPTQDLAYGYLKQVSAIPETIFVDGEGNILHSVIGARDKEGWQKIIDEVVDELGQEE